MKEHPILFSGEMVRAILDGRKIQTRRVAQLVYDGEVTGNPNEGGAGWEPDWTKGWGRVKPGSQLWVRETCWILGWWKRDGKTRSGKDGWRFVIDSSHQVRFDDPPREERCTKREGPIPGWCRRPSIHMPRWASRITLEVTSVRVEQLQDISEEDARAEGAKPSPTAIVGGTHLASFRRLWDAINAKRAPWESNPWVWVIGFEVPRG